MEVLGIEPRPCCVRSMQSDPERRPPPSTLTFKRSARAHCRGLPGVFGEGEGTGRGAEFVQVSELLLEGILSFSSSFLLIKYPLLT